MGLHINDYQESQDIFAERSEKLHHHHHHPRIVNLLRHHLNPGTAIV